MAERSAGVSEFVSDWMLPMLRSLPHRVSARLREHDLARENATLRRLRRRDRPELIARKSMGFNSLTDMRVDEFDKFDKS